MADTGRPPHLARNAALAALVVLGSTAAVTAGAVRPGTQTGSCPGGENWVVAQPVDVTMAGYGPGPRSAPGPPGGPGRTPTRSTAPPAAGSAQPAAAPLTLAGCVDTRRLHPMPASGDGRG